MTMCSRWRRSLAPGVQSCRAALGGLAPAPVGQLAAFQSRSLVTATSPKKIKKFFEATSAAQHGDMWRVFLDSKPVKTPKGTFLELPSQKVAQAVADEWAGQGEFLKPKEMPLTTVACTAVDLIRPEKEACVERLIPYLACDSLCFRDDNKLLAALQEEEWGPQRQWFEGRFGVTLGVSEVFFPPKHPEDTLEAVAKQLRDCNEWELTALEIATNAAKSLIVASALTYRTDVSAEGALRLALLEEFFQIERCGFVEGEHDVSHASLIEWFSAAQLFGQAGHELRAE